MARRKPFQFPPRVIYMDYPCKSGQPFVAADGSCLRCGADQGVHGYACGDTMQRDLQIEANRLDALTNLARESAEGRVGDTKIENERAA